LELPRIVKPQDQGWSAGAYVDFAEFTVAFTDEPGVVRKVWLFSMVLGHSRWLWGWFVASQNLQSVSNGRKLVMP
jgi:hypothetical protein